MRTLKSKKKEKNDTIVDTIQSSPLPEEAICINSCEYQATHTAHYVMCILGGKRKALESVIGTCDLIKYS